MKHKWKSERVDLLINNTFSEVDLFDGSNFSFTFQEFNTFNRREHELGTEVVSIKDQGLEHPFWSYLSDKLLTDFGDPHLGSASF